MPTPFDVPPDDLTPKDGDRMLIGTDGGGPSSIARLVYFPPPLEIVETGGVYVLVDDGHPNEWRYQWVPAEP